VAGVGWFVASFAVFLFLASVYAVPAAICRLMTAGYRRFTAAGDITPGPTAVVVLSGKVEIRAFNGQITRSLAPTCAARVNESVRVYQLIAPEWMISAGGLPRPERGVPTCAELMRDELIRLGVPAGRILIEIESRTTHEGAVRVATMLRKLGVRRAVIVTSEVHLPRSLGAFRAQGVRGTPAGAIDPDASREWRAWLVPSAHGLRFSGDVVHELLGLLAYRCRGWQA
jgi:uncharacterized SAM-binding protein YcdF (DUF218 family)